MFKPTKYVRGESNKKFCVALYVALLKQYGANKWVDTPGYKMSAKITTDEINKLYGCKPWGWYWFSDRRQMQFIKLRTLGLLKLRQKSPGGRIQMKLCASPEVVAKYFIDII